MRISEVTIEKFRSIKKATFHMKDITAVVGENAAGKTNLVEAIQFLSLARSFRTNDDAVLIQDGKNVAVIDATLSEGTLTRNIRIELSLKTQRKST